MEYPLLPPESSKKKCDSGDLLSLDEAASEALQSVDAIENNRIKREALEGN